MEKRRQRKAKPAARSSSASARLESRIDALAKTVSGLLDEIRNRRPGWACSGCEAGCDSSCDGGCIGNCEGGCTGGGCEGYCESGCQTGCEGGCEMGCLGSCTSGCTGCESGCQNACENGCEMGCTSCEGGCENLCEASCETSATSGDDRGRCGSSDVMMRPEWWEAIINPAVQVEVADTHGIVLGTVEECRLRLEPGLGVLSPGGEVVVRTGDGKLLKGRSLSTWVLRIRVPIEAMVNVAEGGNRVRSIGGGMVAAEAQYKRGVGIAVTKGSAARVRFRGRIYDGKLEEDVATGMGALGGRLPRSKGIRQITR